MNKIKIAIVGIGNCASSLIQGIHYYDGKNPEDAIGLMHWDIGGYKPSDIEVVAAFDVDERKVGKTIDEALKINAKAIDDYLGNLPKHKFHCSILGHEALADAVKEYEKNHSAGEGI